MNKNSAADAVALMGDMIANPVFDAVQVEAEKANVHKIASSMDPEKVTYDNIHYTSFRVSFFLILGPLLGTTRHRYP